MVGYAVYLFETLQTPGLRPTWLDLMHSRLIRARKSAQSGFAPKQFSIQILCVARWLPSGYLQIPVSVAAVCSAKIFSTQAPTSTASGDMPTLMLLITRAISRDANKTIPCSFAERAALIKHFTRVSFRFTSNPV